jgi:hypothetical protein
MLARVSPVEIDEATNSSVLVAGSAAKLETRFLPEYKSSYNYTSFIGSAVDTLSLNNL